mmetsp:Transcript_12011/g.16035  ORF Transcript_12011/g.16035 Transcript_12011/m.16035 type:complete len:989 (+) Transcript_12011:67-3033(+)
MADKEKPPPEAKAPPASSATVPQDLVPSQAVSSRSRNNGRSRRNRGGKKKIATANSAEGSGSTPTAAMNADAKAFVPKEPQKEGQGQKPTNDGGNNGKKRANRRGRGGKDKKDASDAAAAPKASAQNNDADSKPLATTSTDADGAPDGKSKNAQKKRQRQRRRGNKNTDSNDNDNDKDAKINGKGKGGAGKRKGGGGGGNNNKFSWRKQIPPGTVDPISLESLKSLKYPPFALAANPPHTPIPTWPETPSESLGKKGDGKAGSSSDIEKEQRRILEEQWGKVLTGDDVAGEDEQSNNAASSSPTESSKRYYHLFDGRVLAYYLVSQLQFIDPMNRRDLTRDELLNLDSYLKRHKLGRAGVVEAYDAHGKTISTAGVAGQTERGRAEILQQEASSLLAALFSGGSSGNGGGGSNGFQNDFERQYMAHERTRSRQQQQRGGRGRTDRGTGGEDEDQGIYAHDHGGMLIIDDDENPGLRGGISQAIGDETGLDASDGSGGVPPSTLYSARHIAETHSHGARARADNFPALPVAASGAEVADNSQDKGEPTVTAKPSRSLKTISKTVKKTDPAEIARQKKARDEARRRAALANLAYMDPSLGNASVAMDPNQGLASASNGAFTASTGPTEGQILRNQAMADALGVAPATLRINAGWARPTATKVELDEFGNELGVSQYPDSLILEARDKYMGELLKLERRWKAFLADDKAASHPLRPMHRELRKFVHEYSDFWRLHTESFDPEPRRYVHCVKLRDTSAPYPLLSEAVRKWRGPGTLPAAPVQIIATGEKKLPNGTRSLEKPPDASIVSSPDAKTQSAGQTTTSRELTWLYEDRVPLNLAPRSVPLDAPPGAMFEFADGSSLPEGEQIEAAETQPSSRFSDLHANEGRERIRLNLAPRTVPREMPEYRPPTQSTYDAADAMERIRKAKDAERKRLQQKEEDRKALLAEAFASDSESEGEKEKSGKKIYARQKSDSSSDWEEEEALFHGSDEEE